MNNRIENKEQLCELWTNIYNRKGRPDWSHIIPYYDNKIVFQDSIQKIRGIKDFTEMTERLVQRSQDLKMKVVHSVQNGKIIMIEWEMTLSFGKYPNSTLYGISRLTLNEHGKIIRQRDYYDLWGDIFDNIPFMKPKYRKFMRKKFG